MRYIEMNPVRAFMVRTLQDYIWLSYHTNVLGSYDHLISEHVSYLGLGKKSKQQEYYKGLFLEYWSAEILDDIR